MAKPPVPKPAGKAEKPAAPEKRNDGGISILALIIVTLIGAGAGAGFGTQIPPLPHAEVEKKLEEQLHPIPKTIFVQLAPLTTNLAGDVKTWIRMESALMVEADLPEKAQIIANKVAEDLLSYLRTVTLEQFEGASGFQHLHEDLNERARLRSEGKVTELLIQALIIE